MRLRPRDFVQRPEVRGGEALALDGVVRDRVRDVADALAGRAEPGGELGVLGGAGGARAEPLVEEADAREGSRRTNMLAPISDPASAAAGPRSQRGIVCQRSMAARATGSAAASGARRIVPCAAADGVRAK